MSGTPLSNFLRMLREKNGYTQDQVAKILGVSRANYSHYENDRITPSSDSLCRLADFYHVPLPKLVRLAGSTYTNGEDFEDQLDRIEESSKEYNLEESKIYDRLYNNFLKECSDMLPEEIAKWLSIEDRELVYYLHNISDRDRQLVTNLVKMMLAKK